MSNTKTTTEALAGISLDMILTDEQIRAIDVLAMDEDVKFYDWSDFHGSSEINKLVYMAYKLNALLKTLEPTTT